MDSGYLKSYSGGGQGGGSPRKQGAGGVRETGEERAGSGREIQKGKVSLFVTAYHPVKETNPTNFIFEKSQKTKIRTRKTVLLPVKLETFSSRLHDTS